MSKSLLPERDRKRASPPSESQPKLARGTRDIAPSTIKVARGTRDMAPLGAQDGDDDTIVVDADPALGDLSLDSDVGETSDVSDVSDSQAADLAAATDARMIELGKRRFG